MLVLLISLNDKGSYRHERLDVLWSCWRRVVESKCEFGTRSPKEFVECKSDLVSEDKLLMTIFGLERRSLERSVKARLRCCEWIGCGLSKPIFRFGANLLAKFLENGSEFFKPL
jgi:hypothetical protein